MHRKRERERERLLIIVTSSAKNTNSNTNTNHKHAYRYYTDSNEYHPGRELGDLAALGARGLAPHIYIYICTYRERETERCMII